MSHNPKRKAVELDEDSSDDEEPTLGRQVLPIATLPDDFDGVPMDGLQYLFTVRRDARLLPHVTRVVNPYEVPEPELQSSSASQALDLGAGMGMESVRSTVLPSGEWRETFLRRFKNFRKNSVQRTIHVHVPDSSTKLMPDRKERDLWWAFLAGRPESEWNPPKKSKQPKPSRWQQRNLKKDKDPRDEVYEDAVLPYDVNEIGGGGTPEASSAVAPLEGCEFTASLQDDSARLLASHPTLPSGTESSTDIVPTPEVPLVPLPREPTPTLLQRIDHRYAVHLLMYFGHWINVRLEEGHLPYTDITQSHARWIFSLLSRVDDWISGDETSLLRNLARGCMNLMVRHRNRPKGEDGEVCMEATIDERSCWMIITIISGLWGQTDLWMDAENVLSKVESSPT